MLKRNILFGILGAWFLTGCSQPYMATQVEQSSKQASSLNAANQDVKQAERLGTKWGDDISSQIREVYISRVSNQPIAEASVRYANKDYNGRAVNSISLAAGKISFALVDDQSNPLPIYRVGQEYYLAGKPGQSYQLQYENNTGKTFEVVASVDGLDVLDGTQASRRNSGYVLKPYSSLNIAGFRKSEAAVASFTFSQPSDAYAANTTSGSIKNTGIIGTVIYELKAPVQSDKPKTKYAPAPNAFPAD